MEKFLFNLNNCTVCEIQKNLSETLIKKHKYLYFMESSITLHSSVTVQPQDSSEPQKDTIVKKSVPQQSLNAEQKEALAKFRKGLPIYRSRGDILAHVKKNPITIISGDTGSGKSTQLPQYLYESGLHHDRIIGITQPRRVAALTLAQRVALEVI